VLHERRELHVERLRQLADGGRSGRKSLQDLPSSRVGEGVKNVVSGCELNHSHTVLMLGLSDLTDGVYNTPILL
jgi:hypothetical protein